MKIKGVAAVVMSSLIVAGCSNTNLNMVKAVQLPPKRVSLEIVNKTGSNQLEEEMLGLKRILVEQLNDEGIEVTDSKDVATVTADFKYYNSGNRALRAFVGFGAGRIAYDSNWKVVSAAGNELGSCNIDGWRAMGFFGGSLSSVHEDMAEAVADCVKGHD